MSETLACSDILDTGTERSLHSLGGLTGRLGRAAQVLNRNAAMHDAGKSDVGIVPMKALNKSGKPGEEVLEGRLTTKGNPIQPTVSHCSIMKRL